jgi:ArsR family transcriptional regulator
MNTCAYIHKKRIILIEKVANSLAHCEDPFIHEDQVKIAQTSLIDGLTATYLAQTFQALADPSRVRIISALAAAELCVCDLAAVLGMTQSAVSHHVKSRKEGRVVYYTLQDEHIRDLFERGLSHLVEDK